MAEDHVDVAVVGAGISGLFVASRISTLWPDTRVRVFDAAAEVGGRIASVAIPGVPLVAEMGAMRYLPGHTRVVELARDLGLTSREFGFRDTAFFYLRGCCLPGTTFGQNCSWSQRTPLPFRVLRQDHRPPFDLIQSCIRNVLLNLSVQPPREKRDVLRRFRKTLEQVKQRGEPLSFTTFSREQWQLIKRYGKFDGKWLYDIGFMDLIHQGLDRGLDAEAYQLAFEGCGYESILTMWNAAEAIPWFLADFSAIAGYQTINGGMQQLTDRLYETLRRKRPRVVHFRHVLQSLERDHRHLRLRFVDGAKGHARLVRANSVVLALPQRALEQIDLRGLRFLTPTGTPDPESDADATARFRAITRHFVTPNALLKLVLLYDRQWWPVANSSDGLGSFRVITDQPLRQIYHFGADHEYPRTTGRPTPYRYVVAYSDSRSADYWKQLNELHRHRDVYVRPSFRDRLDRDGRDVLDRLLYRYGVAREVVDRAQSQLARVHGIPEARLPEPCVAFIRHWMDFPYHAGWHAWNPGFSTVGGAEIMLKPFLGSKVYVCGEAFSNDQGWIEGALETAAKVVELLEAEHRR